jgi:hypothetical protein
MFRYPTIHSLAEHLDRGGGNTRLVDAELRGRMRRQRSQRTRARTANDEPSS